MKPAIVLNLKRLRSFSRQHLTPKAPPDVDYLHAQGLSTHPFVIDAAGRMLCLCL
jgi:hypothetical protein